MLPLVHAATNALVLTAQPTVALAKTLTLLVVGVEVAPPALGRNVIWVRRVQVAASHPPVPNGGRPLGFQALVRRIVRQLGRWIVDTIVLCNAFFPTTLAVCGGALAIGSALELPLLSTPLLDRLLPCQKLIPSRFSGHTLTLLLWPAVFLLLLARSIEVGGGGERRGPRPVLYLSSLTRGLEASGGERRGP